MSHLSEEEQKRRLLIDSIPEVDIIDSSKENIKPRRQGRHAAALILDPVERERELQIGEAKFQKKLALLDEEDDPLAIYLDYINWTIEMYPFNDIQLLGLLKDATSRFVNEIRYRHDPRYLKMWLEYASLVNDPGDIYSYLMSKGIGQTLALFYEEYANCLEENQKYKEVIRVYEQGIEQHAEPIKRLERSYNVFKKRMEARQTQGTPREREREARIQMDALRATGHRTMLGEKFDSRSRVSLHPNQFASIQQQSGSSSSSNSSIRTRRTDLFGNNSGGESNLPTGPSFQVYTDTSSSLDQIPTTSLSTSLPSLGLSASQGIENERIKEKFAGATLPQADPVIIRPITKFQVYQDEADSESTIYKKKEATKPLLHVSDGSESSLSRIRRYPILSDDDNTTQSIKVHKKAKSEDRTYEKLVRRFTKNGSDYVRTTDSKEKSEYICILNTFSKDESIEECRYMYVNKNKKKARVHRFEPIMKEEYTEESLAAMKSINAILYTEKTEDEDEIEKDLTWTRDIQQFKSIKRAPARENDE
ncbi:hypothetical protein G6F62_004113 [Rhizopus arrhizus]|uniref:BUB1 N-terminal domain-containing protein n=1 Tax=Rhizopus oryzae TaxID=64495 RepID=A0A9P6X597_RHIOR|nr:hypothetical protein G6F20_001888 [Rhizopus arrhizus]KAG0826453.1 hypothetical protein G6F19_009283 [Rhizopus arrhizus]KAG0879387.1 hypothetical protein G6F15_009345 [Rhizopus arrhizus]KAG0895123.1 hypothetical protein G6F34_008513 [Rhizopus arrhizus]KAG0915544.1 hypothetical protein G6F33_003240 [Rhizopus arrhizus]